jgi:hypothetical protein
LGVTGVLLETRATVGWRVPVVAGRSYDGMVAEDRLSGLGTEGRRGFTACGVGGASWPCSRNGLLVERCFGADEVELTTAAVVVIWAVRVPREVVLVVSMPADGLRLRPSGTDKSVLLVAVVSDRVVFCRFEAGAAAEGAASLGVVGGVGVDLDFAAATVDVVEGGGGMAVD